LTPGKISLIDSEESELSLKICFLSITHVYYDTRILHKECRSLVEAGFNVVHIAPDKEPNHKHPTHGVHIELYQQRSGLLGRIIRYVDLYRRAVNANADCYHCNELESWLVGLFIKIFHKNKRVLFDVHEHYPSRFEEPPFPKWSRLVGGRVVRLLYQILTRWTDYLIFAKRSVAKDFPYDPRRQAYVFNYGPLWVKEQRKNDNPGASVQRIVKKDIVAIHVGGFSRNRGWPQLLQALDQMKHQELHILCLGAITEGKEVLLAEAQRLGVTGRVQLKERVPYDKMFDYLSDADIGLMLYQPGIQNHIFAFPMKLYDYMLAGLPVIGPEFAIEVTPVVREEKCGLLIDTSEPKQIAQALDWLVENPDLAYEMGCRGRQAIIDKYNWEKESRKLIKIYSDFAAELGKI